MDWQSDQRGEKQVGAIAKALKGAEHPLSRHRPGPRGRGDLLARQGDAGREEGAEGRQGPPHHLQRDHPQRRARTRWRAPRDLDQPLIEAYLARRALDYLVGFTLSPVLWRKLPGSRSAGRVQSVALRLICEREAEIEAFRAREYWTVEADFTTPAGAPFTARLTHLDGKKLEQFDLPNEASWRMRAKRRVEAGRFHVGSVEKKRVKRNPHAAVHHLDPAAGGIAQARLRRAADHAPGAAALRGRRARRRDHRPDHLHADRRRADGARGDRRDPRPRRGQLRRQLPAGGAARVPDQGQERPGGARGDPPDRRRAHARQRRALPLDRSAPALRADLEAGRGLADAVGRTRPGQRRGDRRPRHHAARHRLGRRVRRLPQAVPRGHRRCGRGRRGPHAAADGGARSAGPAAR